MKESYGEGLANHTSLESCGDCSNAVAEALTEGSAGGLLSSDKKKIIADAVVFVEIRLLRNEIAHEYQSETIHVIFEKVLQMTPALLEGVDLTINYAAGMP